MKRLSIGIVDYGIGNHASMQSTLKKLGYASRVSNDKTELEECDLLVLPGVGSFHEAMAGLNRYELLEFLQEWALHAKPLIGICLGMQILADNGIEGGHILGLGLIPGEAIKMEKGKRHIGWNDLKLIRRDPCFIPYESKNFYFNHLYIFRTDTDNVIAESDNGTNIPSVVRNGTVIGLQFHPEKSQNDGLNLFRDVINGLCNA